MNNTTSSTPHSCPGEDSMPAKLGKTAGFCTLALMSFIGNSLVILVIFKNRSMKTTKNCLIVSMALSDILFSAFTMPKSIVETFSPPRRWFVSGWLGELLCKFVPFVQDVAIAVSILSMVAIAADRFYGLTYPLQKGLFTRKFRRAVVVLTWVLAFAFHGPHFYTYKLSGSGSELICVSSWAPTFDDLKAMRVYFLTLSILLFFLPVAVVTILYGVIARNFKQENVPGNQTLGTKKRLMQQKKGVVKMLVAVVVLFVVCWLPFNVIMYISLFHTSSNETCGFKTLGFCTIFLAYSNSSLTPGIYFVFSKNFRRGLQNIFHRGNLKSVSTRRDRSVLLSRFQTYHVKAAETEL